MAFLTLTQAIVMANAIVNNTLPKMDANRAAFATARVVGDSLVVAYHLPGCVTSEVIQFNGVKDWAYGYPNDEGLSEHTWWGNGPTLYQFHEVQPSESDVVQ